ncbi:MAG: 3-hydroxyacyl-ACP dehydratase FabZ [Alphaproteobacteria bacterium]|nr:3-hydroxyacyl-ACP dehydratase FabZ [Alphaproteobacteria bacterium]
MSDEQTTALDIARIMDMIPHRYPILLVDRVLEITPGESAIALKNVTMNEPHFMGHFPDFPVMPGVLIIEAMAQTAAIVAVDFLGAEAEGKVVYFMSIDEAKFRRPVTPGDSLHLHVTKLQARRTVWKFEGVAKVGDQVCASAKFAAMIADRA